MGRILVVAWPSAGRWDDEVEKTLTSLLSAKGAPFVFSPRENRLDNSARDSFVDGPHTPDVTAPCLVPTITTRLNASRASLFLVTSPRSSSLVCPRKLFAESWSRWSLLCCDARLENKPGRAWDAAQG